RGRLRAARRCDRRWRGGAGPAHPRLATSGRPARRRDAHRGATERDARRIGAPRGGRAGRLGSGDIVALVIGTLLAGGAPAGALAFVLQPLFFGVAPGGTRRQRVDGDAEDSAIVALREIEFDRATGKLSDADYAELRRTYTERALYELRSEASQAEPADPIEA